MKKWSGQVRSGHQSRSNDTMSKNICNFTMATVFKGSMWDFQDLIRALVPTKRISQNFAFGDQTSGQCCDFTIIRQRKNVEMPFIPKVRMEACYLLVLYSIWSYRQQVQPAYRRRHIYLAQVHSHIQAHSHTQHINQSAQPNPTSQVSRYSYIIPLSMTHTQFWPTSPSGHSSSDEVKFMFASNFW